MSPRDCPFCRKPVSVGPIIERLGPSRIDYAVEHRCRIVGHMIVVRRSPAEAVAAWNGIEAAP